MNVNECLNYDDFRKLAKKNLPSPIFHYIDGGSDDEETLIRNTEAFNDCDLVPNVLANVGKPDLSTTVFGRRISMPIFYLLQQCKDCIILMEMWPLPKPQKNLIPFIACPQWQIPRSKR